MYVRVYHVRRGARRAAAREAREETGQDGPTEVRHETDRLERCDELRLTSLRLRAPLRAAPRRRCAWPRCVVLPDPRRDVAFSVQSVDSTRDVTSESLSPPRSLILSSRTPCGLRTCLHDPALPASAAPVTPPSLRLTDHAAMPSPSASAATVGAPSPFSPS